jgi:hypothetical protein
LERLRLVAAAPELRRYAPPAALLLAATLAVVFLRPVLHPGKASPAPRPKVVRARAKRPPARVAFVAVRSGDTLGAIAARRGTTVARLLALNPGIDATLLRVGQRVRVK